MSNTNNAAPPSFDPSIIGISYDEIAEMDAEDRNEAIVDSIFRAADIAQAVIAAFGREMSQAERDAINDAANQMIAVARGR